MDQQGLQNNKTLQILKAAEEGKYGVVAAVAYNIEHILGLVKAAEQKRSPLIIQFFPWVITYSDGLLVHTAAKAAREATVPISVHLDHCQTEELVKKACELPFDSIMVDMSHHPKAENLAKTKELVAYCHARGKTAEAEPGRIEGGEHGISDTADLSGLMTTAEEAKMFVAAGVDFLAPAFGNVHGQYGPRGVVLEWDRLEMIQRITSAAGVMIALHGVLEFPEELTRKLIAAGITKINVNRDLLWDFHAYLEQNINDKPLQQLLEEGAEKVTPDGMEKITDLTAKYMDAVLSSGKA